MKSHILLLLLWTSPPLQYVHYLGFVIDKCDTHQSNNLKYLKVRVH